MSPEYKQSDEIKDILLDKVVDCLIISETKLDSSFKDSIFEVDGYKLQRRDRTDHHGDVLTLNVRLLKILCMKLLLIKPNG